MGDLFEVQAMLGNKRQLFATVARSLPTVASLAGIPGLQAAVASGKLLTALPSLISSGFLPTGLLGQNVNLAELEPALQKILQWTGQSSLETALEIINSLPTDRCGATTLGEPEPGEVALSGDSHTVMYYVEESPEGVFPGPNIRNVANQPELIRDQNEIKRLFREALAFWGGKMKMAIASTPNPDGANLIVSGRNGGFGSGVVAVGDIGPLFTRKCRLVFNRKLTMNRREFQYTVAHEFGHCLGIHHADVPSSGSLLSPVMDIARGIQPSDADFAAAKRIGWNMK